MSEGGRESGRTEAAAGGCVNRSAAPLARCRRSVAAKLRRPAAAKLLRRCRSYASAALPLRRQPAALPGTAAIQRAAAVLPRWPAGGGDTAKRTAGGLNERRPSGEAA